MLQQVNATTWQNILPSGERVWIGNPDSSKFEPHLKLDKWGTECGLGVSFPLVGTLKPQIIGDRVELVYKDYKLQWYPQNSMGELGGYEF
jgi:hypothetical protein